MKRTVTNMPSTLSASQVADHFLALAQEHGLITHLKLQKLLYFAQGYHLALSGGGALFRDSIQAWKFGPVIPEVYHSFKYCGNAVIKSPGKALAVDPRVTSFLRRIWNTFAGFSAIKLSEISHLPDGPWHRVVMDNGGDVGKRLEIPHEAMRNYFAKFLKN